jgi:large subunit ribosomal protein L25
MSAELKATARERVGKGAARNLRRQGLVPAVIYGDNQPPLPVVLTYQETHRRIHAGGFLSHVITLDVDGSEIRVLPRDYQLEPVRDTIVHVDFLRVSKTSRIRVDVPVRFINEVDSPGLKRGGVLNVVRHEIEVTAPADSIPESFTFDLAGLDIGDSIHIQAIKLPDGVKPTIARNFTVATVAAPSAFKSEAEEAAEAAAKAAAAAAAAGATAEGVPAEGAAPAEAGAAPAAAAKGATPAAADKKEAPKAGKK